MTLILLFAVIDIYVIEAENV